MLLLNRLRTYLILNFANIGIHFDMQMCLKKIDDVLSIFSSTSTFLSPNKCDSSCAFSIAVVVLLPMACQPICKVGRMDGRHPLPFCHSSFGWPLVSFFGVIGSFCSAVQSPGPTVNHWVLLS